jgi:hypothetical protein
VLPKDARRSQPSAKQFLVSGVDKLEAVGGNYLCGCPAFAWEAFSRRRQIPDGRRYQTLGAAERCARHRARIGEVNRYEGRYTTRRCARRFKPSADNATACRNMNIEEGIHKPLVECADVLGYIHVGRHRGLLVRHCQLGRGVPRVADAHYRAISVESFAAINPDLIAATCLWRPPKYDSMTMASKGLEFLKERTSEYFH